jgi:hypothetical protein
MNPIVTLNRESHPWHGYSFYGVSIKDRLFSPSFFNEYRMAVQARDFTLGNKDIGNKIATKETYIDTVVKFARLSEFGKDRPPPGPDAIKRLARIIPDRPAHSQDAKRRKQKLMDNASILTYIVEGDWQTHPFEKTDPLDLTNDDDKVALLWFGKHPDLPLIWFVISYKNTEYMRLHAWSRSILTPYLYELYFEQESAPSRAGVMALSWLLHIMRCKRLYGEFLPGSISVFKRMDTRFTNAKAVQTEKEYEEAIGDPQVIEITDDMKYAHLDQEKIDFEDEIDIITVNQCVLCGAHNAKYYMAHTGPDVRYCGKKSCMENY